MASSSVSATTTAPGTTNQIMVWPTHSTRHHPGRCLVRPKWNGGEEDEERAYLVVGPGLGVEAVVRLVEREVEVGQVVQERHDAVGVEVVGERGALNPRPVP